MASRKSNVRRRILLGTACAALMALPSAANAQLVRSADLNSAVDSAGNPNQLAVTDTNATTTDMEVKASVVVAEWTDFNVDLGDTVNVKIDPSLAIAEATLFNRVIGGNPSNINGTINATGINFWLINQNGILFGSDTSVSAKSFFASTIDVANQDIFDFYNGTDLFGNGADTLNFSGASTQTVQSLANASFVTDGSLAFVGQQLDLTGSFDAGTGRAIFIAASNVDVSFTPGSPLSYTVNAGTTVATQNIDGTIAGASAEFAVFTAAGVVNALLDVDASITATTAVSTDRGVSLIAQGLGAAKPDTEFGGVISTNGNIVMNSQGDITATANITGNSIDIDAGGAIGASNLTSNNGSIDLNAVTSITAGVIDTSGNGGAILTSAGNITTTSITSNEPGATNGFIDVESTGGGTLDLGALSSDGDIALDTSGLVTTSTITTLNDLTIGGTTTTGAVTFTGNVDADIVDINSTGAVSGLDIDATDGNLDITASSISGNALSATGGNVILQATGNVTTASITSNKDAFMMGGDIDVDSTGGGTLNLGNVTGDGAANFDTSGTLTLGTVNVDGAMEIGGTADPTTLNLNGDITAGSFTSNSANAFTTANDITATNGNLSITAPSISTGDLDAEKGGGVILTSAGNITTTSITSNEPGATNGFIDVESTGGGTLDLGALSSDGDIALDTSGLVTTSTITTLNDLTIGGTTTTGAVTFTGNVDADIVDINSTGAVSGLDIDATDGNLDITASSISGNALSATGGNVILQATGNVTTASITSNKDAFMMGGDIDVDSTGGGTLNLGNVTGDGAANFDTSGTLTLGTVNVDGAMEIGGTADPTTLNLNGDITAGSFTSNSANAFTTANDITATNGNLSITAPSISTGDLDAEKGGGVILTSAGNITTTSITSNEPGATNGFIDVESTGGGTLDLGALSSDGDIALDTSGLVTTSTITTLNDLTIGGTTTTGAVTFTGNVDADIVDINSTGAVSGLDIDATDGNLDITASSISGNALSATGGNVILQATGNVTTASITSNKDAFMMGGDIDVDSTGGGTLNLGNVTGDGAANFDTSGTLTLGTVNVDGAMEIGGTADPTTLNLNGDITAGSFTSNSANAFTTANDITATNGNLSITAPSISTGDLDAEKGGGVILTSAGNITTTSITSNEPGATNGFIDVESTGGGTLDLGALSSDGDIALDTSGLVTTSTITTLNDLTIGGTTTTGAVTFTGNVDADIVDINSTGAVSGLDIDATDGNLDITASSISGNALSATGGNVILQATGNVTTASITSNKDAFMMGGDIDVDSTGGGTLNLGNVTGDGAANFDTSGTLTLGTVNVDGAMEIGGTADPTTLNLNGDITAGSFTSNSANAFTTANDITATNGNLSITAPSISTGDLDAEKGGGVILTSAGNITTTSITSNEPGATNGFIDVESTGGGTLDLGALSSDGDIALDTSGLVTTSTITTLNDLTIGGTTTTGAVTFTGNVDADIVDINSTGAVSGLDIDATDGNLDITASSISGNALSATGGNVILQATGNVTTASITSNKDAFMMGGDIDVDSTGGGTLNLGNVTGDGAANFDTSGTLTLGTVNVDGAMEIGGTADPTTLNLNGDITAGSFTSNSANAFTTANDITATNGNLSITAPSISTGDLDAEKGGGVILTSAGNITTTSITSNEPGATNGFIDVESTGGGTLDLGALSSDGDIALDTSGLVTTSTITTLNDLTIGGTTTTGAVTFTGNVDADIVDINSTGAVSGLDIDATDGNLDITASSISGNALSATGGNVILQATGNVTTASITSNKDAFMMGGDIDVDSTGGGTLNLGNVTGDGAANFDTSGAIGTGSITSDSASLTAGGAISTGAITVNQALDLMTTSASLTTGDVIVNNAGATLTLQASGATSDVTSGLLNTNGGDILVSAGRNVTTGAVSTALAGLPTAGTIGIRAGGSVISGQIDAGEDLLLSAGSTASMAGGSAGDDVRILADGDIDITGPVTTTGAGSDTRSVAFGGAPGNSSMQFLAEAADLNGANIFIDSQTGAIGIDGALTSAKNVDVSSAGALTLETNGQITGGQVVLSTDTAFINNRGADAITASGNWIVYSVDPTANTFGGLDSGNTAIWNSTDLTRPKSSIADNRYVFSFQPTLVVGSTDVTKTYGDDISATLNSNFGILSGLQIGVAGAFLGDTQATALSGTPIIVSAGAGAAANVAGSPYAMNISLGSLASPIGYAITLSSSGELTVDPKAITASVSANDKTYDGTTAATGSVSLSGVIAGDDVGTSGTTFTFSDKNAGVDKVVTIAGTSLTGGDAGNYTLTVPASTLADIFAKAITASVSANDKTYDGTTAATGSVSLSGVIAGDDVGTSGTTFTFSDKNAGVDKVVTIAGTSLTGGDAGNYTLTVPASTLADIFAKAITASVSANDKTYDGTTAATGSVSLSGVIAGDDVGTSGTTFTFSDKNAGVDKVVTIAGTSLTGGDAGNYTLTVPASTLADIFAKAITASVSANDKTYDGTTAATGSVSLSGVIAGDDVGTSGTTFTFSDKNAGVDKVVTIAGTSLTGGDAGNYTLTVPASTLADIFAKAITASVSANDKTYDGTTAATGSVSLSGVIAGDDVGTSGTTFTFSDKNAGVDKVVTIAGTSLTGGDAGNYTLTVPASTLADIFAKAITASVSANDKTYDGTTAATGSVSLSGVIAGDDVGTSGTTFTFSDKNAGVDKVVTIAGTSLTGGDAGNYTLTVPASTLADIFAKAITASVSANDKTYDGTTDATGSVSLSGVIAGDDVGTSGTTFTFSDKNAGVDKVVTIAGTSLTGGDAGNYTLTVPASTLADIFAKAITASVSANDKTYDGTTAATGSVSLSGVIAGDDVGTSGTTFTFSDKNAGVDKVVTIAGTSLTGGDAGNYTLTVPASTLADIFAKAITASVSANDKTYDGTTAATGSVSLSGVIAGDDVGTSGTTFTFSDKNAGVDKVVTIAGTSLTGGDAGNYTLTVPASTLADILAKELTIVSGDAFKFEGDIDPTIGFSITGEGLIGGDVLIGSVSREGNELPGTYATTIGSLDAGSNYAIVFTGGTFVILPVENVERSVIQSQGYEPTTNPRIEVLDTTAICPPEDAVCELEL